MGFNSGFKGLIAANGMSESVQRPQLNRNSILGSENSCFFLSRPPPVSSGAPPACNGYQGHFLPGGRSWGVKLFTRLDLEMRSK